MISDLSKSELVGLLKGEAVAQSEEQDMFLDAHANDRIKGTLSGST
jgi:hypothetical protein